MKLKDADNGFGNRVSANESKISTLQTAVTTVKAYADTEFAKNKANIDARLAKKCDADALNAKADTTYVSGLNERVDSEIERVDSDIKRVKLRS